MSILFAATYPERVRSLVLYGTMPRFTPEASPTIPGVSPPDQASRIPGGDRKISGVKAHWPTPFFGPIADVPGFNEMYGRIERCLASPTMALMLWDALPQIDVRPLLNTIRTPTLVFGRRGDEVNSVEAAAAHGRGDPGAEFGNCRRDHPALRRCDGICGARLRLRRPAEATGERVLSAVLFTDIVGSTDLLSARGDAHWRHELDAHDSLVDSLFEVRGSPRQARRRRHLRAFRRPHQGGAVHARTCAGPGGARHPRPGGRPHRRMRTARRRIDGVAVHVGRVWRDVGPMKSLKSRGARPSRAPDCVSTAWGPIASRVSRKPPKSSVSRPERAFRHNEPRRPATIGPSC